MLTNAIDHKKMITHLMTTISTRCIGESIFLARPRRFTKALLAKIDIKRCDKTMYKKSVGITSQSVQYIWPVPQHSLSIDIYI